MSVSTFSTFIPDRTALSPTAIREAGFSAQPFPEYPIDQELFAVADLVGATKATLWSWGYGEAPRHAPGLSLEDAQRLAFERNYESVLLALAPSDLWVWIHDEHEFFVFFGPPAHVQGILEAGIFTYPFSEYIADFSENPKRAAYLEEMGRRYTIVP